MNKLFAESELEFDAGDNKIYKVEAIIVSAVYTKKADGYLPGLYYLIFWKSYSEKESTWEPSYTVMHFWIMISTFYKNHPEKLMATSLLLNFALLMAKLSVKPVKSSTKWR